MKRLIGTLKKRNNSNKSSNSPASKDKPDEIPHNFKTIMHKDVSTETENNIQIENNGKIQTKRNSY